MQNHISGKECAGRAQCVMYGEGTVDMTLTGCLVPARHFARAELPRTFRYRNKTTYAAQRRRKTPCPCARDLKSNL
jgi:hypothetical protein